jgi:hypothetical protein
MPQRCAFPSGTQKHRVKDLLPVAAWRLATIGQSAHFCGEIKHLVQIGFESVPARGYDFSFSFKKRRRLLSEQAELAKVIMDIVESGYLKCPIAVLI